MLKMITIERRRGMILMDKNVNAPIISPSDYKKILKQIELKEIALEACSLRTRRDKLSEGKSLKVLLSGDVSYEFVSNEIVLVYQEYTLIATALTKKDYAVSLQCTFRLRYYSQETLSSEFLEVFKTRNVPLNTWPYFREFVQNMTQRMNIPPLTLPLLK